MEANLLRVLLILVGIGVVLGIYFWSRYRQTDIAGSVKRTLARHAERKQRSFFNRSEPVFRFDGIKDDPLDRHRIPGADGASGTSMGTQTAGPGQKIIAFHIAATGGRAFDGADILQAAQAAGLIHGDMQIFHRYDPQGRSPVPVFSMASMVEPGVFPLETMLDGFSTPGLTLFAQFPGPVEPMEVFTQLLTAAQQITDQLGGEMLDETRKRLTKQKLEQVRDDLREYRKRM